jgi:hypothetical protein
MPMPDEDNPNYPIWRQAAERVIAARSALDRTMMGTPERKAPEREHQAAHAAYMLTADVGVLFESLNDREAKRRAY